MILNVARPWHGRWSYNILIMKRNKEAEIATDFLENRISSNERKQKKDLNKWIFDQLVVDHEPADILELCCGTGKQSEYLTKIESARSVTCVDMSVDSAEFIRKQDFYDEAKMTLVTHDIDTFLDDKGKYDLVFCAYGLYYSSDAGQLLDKINEHLHPNGSVVIVGPYGPNNIQLFDLIRSCGVTIGELVIQSSTLFMVNDVWQHAINNYATINARTMVNPVYWNSAEEVMAYWKNSTFFEADKEQLVVGKLEEHFKENEFFINEKHIMLIQMIKDAE